MNLNISFNERETLSKYVPINILTGAKGKNKPVKMNPAQAQELNFALALNRSAKRFKPA